MVAVGFNPGAPKIHSVAERRLNRMGVIAPLADSCVALRRGLFWGRAARGLKPTATIIRSLRDQDKDIKPISQLAENQQ